MTPPGFSTAEWLYIVSDRGDNDTGEASQSLGLPEFDYVAADICPVLLGFLTWAMVGFLLTYVALCAIIKA